MLFVVGFGPTSTLFSLAEGTKRFTIALLNGDDLLDRLASLLTASQGDKMKKEIGLPKGAPKKAKKMDEKMDKKMGMKEGSPADMKADKAMMKKYGK